MTVFTPDTNTLSFFLRKNKNVIDSISAVRRMGDAIVIPGIVYYEIRRGLIAVNAVRKAAAFERFCQMYTVSDITIDDLEKSAHLYAALKNSGQLIEDADILIAGYCINHRYTLVTNNTKHFSRIPDLKLTDWTL